MSIAEEFKLKPIEPRSNLNGISKTKIKNARNNTIIAPDISVDKLDEATEIWSELLSEEKKVWQKSHLSFLRNPQKSSPKK
mgnify:CR=1 FL=1